MSLKVLEITPGSVDDLHERWSRLGVHALVVFREYALQAINSPASSELTVDAIVIRCNRVSYAQGEMVNGGSLAEALDLAHHIRSLPHSIAMFDGKKWCSTPIIAIVPQTDDPYLQGLLDEIRKPDISDCEVIRPTEDNNLGADAVRDLVEDYRLTVLSEFDNLGFIVRNERGRYVLGPALKLRQELEGHYYFGPADRRSDSFTTIHRDHFGIQLDVEEFEALINSSEVDECQLQEFFERNPHFLSIFHTPLSQVRLPAKDGSVLIPDFILKPIVAQKRDSKWEVIDLKLPQEKLLSGKGSRARLSASVMKAIRQLHDYQENIEHPNHAREIEALLGHPLKYPGLGVLIGRLANTDIELLEREQRYHTSVRIVTYDEILSRQQVLADR